MSIARPCYLMANSTCSVFSIMSSLERVLPAYTRTDKLPSSTAAMSKSRSKD